MKHISKETICFKQIQLIIFLGLLLIGGQAKAQQATKVNIVSEDFERAGFSGNYIDPDPGIWTFYNFTYATSVPMADDAGKCIITKIQTWSVMVLLRIGLILTILQGKDIIFLL